MIVMYQNVLDMATRASWNNSMKSPTHFRIRAVAATAVFVLSVAAASATTTNVIFSFGEGEGEYADTDLETDSAGNIYGTTLLGGDSGSERQCLWDGADRWRVRLRYHLRNP